MGHSVRISYTLLPPPMAAVPGKYWTSISLWLHSYSVGKLFSKFTEIAEEFCDASVPYEDEAFAIGFIHDLAQKLGASNTEILERWVKERLELAGFNPSEAREISIYAMTNPAETMIDPMYDECVWRFLWLADRIQGLENPFELFSTLSEMERGGVPRIFVHLVNIPIPQPFLRSLLAEIVMNKLDPLYSEGWYVPIATTNGMLILSDQEKLEIFLDWGDIKRGVNRNKLLPNEIEENLLWNMECCEDPECVERCGKKSKPEECRIHGFKKRDCNKGLYLNKPRQNAYRLALSYFGTKYAGEAGISKIVLPKEVEDMFIGVRLGGVEFEDGGVRCPICGARTPVGFPGDFIQTFDRRMKTEQWNRKLYPSSVNVLMQTVKDYAVDPLCLADVLARRLIPERVLLSINLRAPLPSFVMNDVGILTLLLVKEIVSKAKVRDVRRSIYCDDEFFNVLDTIEKGFEEKPEKPMVLLDAFRNTISIGLRNPMVRHQDEWVRDLVQAGVAMSWGIYPLTISETIPFTADDTLLRYYKGHKSLYGFRPSDKRLGGYVPYVALTLANLVEIGVKKEPMPAFLEILDYPPNLSPTLLQYASPRAFSCLQALRRKMGVMD